MRRRLTKSQRSSQNVKSKEHKQRDKTVMKRRMMEEKKMATLDNKQIYTDETAERPPLELEL